MPTPQTKSGPKKLSELARHVVQPSGIVSTGFRPVHRRSVEMGMPLDGWQQGVARLALAKREGGLYAAGEGGVVLSIPRQVGKTYLIAALVFALCTLFPNLTVIWTAHRTRTHNETFKKMQSMSRRKKIAPYVANVRAANGEQEITFVNGSRILFGARESGFGRGFDEVDVLVLDEAQILSEDAMSDMVPATNAAPNGLVFLMGTPPRPKDPGDVFAGARKRALEGDEDTVYVEFSADPDAKSDDRRQLAKANPSYPHRTSESAIRRMQKLLGSDESFRREGFGIWDEEKLDPKAIKVAAWDRLKAALPEESVVSYGVKFTADGSGVALVAAHKPPLGPVHIQPLKQANLGEGIDWLVKELVALAPGAAQIVIDGKAGVGALISELNDAGVRNKKQLLVPPLDQVLAAHTMFEQNIISGGLSHGGQKEFTAQVTAAKKRTIGKSGGWGWDAPEGGTVVSLDAATLAFWAAKVSKRKPGRKQVLL